MSVTNDLLLTHEEAKALVNDLYLCKPVDGGALLQLILYVESMQQFQASTIWQPDWAKAPAWADFAILYPWGAFIWLQYEPKRSADGEFTWDLGGETEWANAGNINAEGLQCPLLVARDPAGKSGAR